MAEAVQRGVVVVPTMMQRDNFAAIADGGKGKYPTWEGHFRRLYDQRYDQARGLHEAGVQLLIGTDESGGIEHGQYWREAELMVQAGIPAPDVVAYASWATRRYLGFDAIADGASADVVVYQTDPREQIAALRSPKAVILRGRQVA